MIVLALGTLEMYWVIQVKLSLQPMHDRPTSFVSG